MAKPAWLVSQLTRNDKCETLNVVKSNFTKTCHLQISVRAILNFSHTQLSHSGIEKFYFEQHKVVQTHVKPCRFLHKRLQL